MKTKTKLTLGLWFLFLVILIMGLTGTHYIYKMGEESKTILKDNYESIEYAKAMMQQLDELHTSDAAKKETAFALLEKNLALEKLNITEVGEKQLTEELSLSTQKLKENPSPELILSIREKLFKLSEMNMQALVRKSNAAQNNAQEAVIYISLLLAVCIMICFSFIVNFPGYIANPIRQLTEGIKQIANKRYDQRLHFQSGDEFGELADAFNSMAKQLDAYENSNLAKILLEKKRIETIINNMQDPIIVLDEASCILFVNPPALAVLGSKDEWIIGKYAPDIALLNDLMRTLLSDKFIGKELKIYADGKEGYFIQEVFDVINESKKLGKVIVLKNITKFHELDEAKTNFIATISHELKTPISSIKMSVKLLDDDRIGPVNHEQKQLINNISDDTQRLLKITAELLDLAQAETGNIQLSFRKTEPKTIVDYAVDAVKVMAEQKHVNLIVNYAPDTQPVNSDMEKTAWVLVNFLSNAIRYSPENEEVLINVYRKDNDMVFSVKDKGKGIEEKYRSKIFERYFKVPGIDKTQSGTGLGLAISKDFIEAQSGSIWVDSELGEGSAFAFKLPVA